MAPVSQEAMIHVANGTLFYNGRHQNPTLLVNGTLIQIQLKEVVRDSQLNELLYVIIVIMFYATGLMTLVITQIKRQRREGGDVDYYDEYLQRNSQVKTTCQTATDILSKKNAKRTLVPASSPRPEHSVLYKHDTPGNIKLIIPKELASTSSRDRSPMLESIPDEDT